MQTEALPLEPSQEAAVEGFRLSAQQRRLWRVQEEHLSYRSRCALHLSGPLDESRLAAALMAVVERHEILRTTFHRLPGMKVPLQSIGDGTPAWRRTALPGLGEDGLAAVLDELFSRPAPAVADLRREPVVAAELIELSAGSHVLLLDLPALCADSATLALLVDEIAAAYAGADGPASMQYADFSEWQNGWLEEEESQEGRQRFLRLGREALTAAVPYEEPAGDPGFQPAVHRLTLERWHEVEAAAERLGTSPAVFLLAAWQALLGRLTGAAEITVATAFSGRTYEDLERAFGLYVKYLPLAGRPLPQQPFSGLVAGLDAAAREAAGQQDYWLPDEALEDVGTLPYGFDFEDAVPARDLGGLTLSLLRRDCQAERFKLRLAAVSDHGVLTAELGYDAAVLAPAGAERLARQLLTLLQGAVADSAAAIADLPLLDAAERDDLLVARNATAAPLPSLPVHRLFEAQAARTSEATALITPGGSLTYGELDALAERVAGALAECNVGPGSRVGLLFERSPEMVAAMLGVWKAGAAYVALDLDHPEARLAYLLADTAAAAVLTVSPLAGRVPAGTPALCVDALGEPELRPRPAAGPGDPAYVVYTSGSTGRPKGVWIAHRGVANYLTWLKEAYGLDETDRVLQIPAPAFDASVRDLFGPLVHGASVVLLDGAAARDPRAIARGIDRYAPSCVLSIVPTLLRGVLAAAGEGGSALRLLLVSGEPLRREDVAAARRAWGADLTVANQYGPTECTMTSSYHLAGEAGGTGALPIGRPIANTRFYVLDERLQPVPAGLPGELAIGGPGLAFGYLGAPDLTAASFIPDPFGEPGGRLYRTGDRVRWAGPDRRELEFLGRIDHQVKLRGVRVEPQEVAAVLAQHPAVAEAAAVVRELPSGEPGLVAYVAADQRQAPAVPEEQRHVLPNGMLVAQRNRHETDFFYEQIFVGHVEFRHGVRVPEGGVIFDVGANIGLFTLFAHQACRRPRVFSFEPIPEIFATLRANAELYGLDAVVENCGLSSQGGEATFAYYPRSSCQSGYYPDAAEETRMLKAVVARQRTGGAGDLSDLLGASYFEKLIEERMEVTPVTCALKTVSQVIAERGLDRVDLLKIDVEKAELDVLLGIRDEDWGKIRQIVIEGHDLDGLLARVTALLESRGYDLVVEQDETLEETCLYNVYAFRDGRPVASEVAPLEVRPFPAPAAALLSVDALRSFAAERLPAALVPAAFVVLDELPRTPNGKLDAKALPAPGSGDAEGGDATVPRNQVEELLAGIWGEVLGLGKVAVHLNFFESGGHSLLATQLLARVQGVFGIELPLRTIFESPTVAQLAGIVEAALAVGGRRPPRIERVRRDGELPLSFAQQRHWFLHRLEGGSALLNVWGAVALSGQLDLEVLERSLGRILERHEVLRTTFPEVAGEPRLRIHPPAGFRLPVVDLTPLPEDERRQLAGQRIEIEARRPFDLAEGPLFRALLLRLEETEHVIVISMHHIAADGWSSSILVRELGELYAAGIGGREPRLPELPVQYADFASWQRRWLAGDVLEAQLGYWERQLAGAPEALDLPTDRLRSGRESFAHGRQPVVCPAPLAGALRALSRRRGVTVFTTLLAGLQVLLHWLSGQDDVSVGSPIASRNRIETEGLIGCFINALVLRARLGGDPTFEEILDQAGETVLGAYAHQDLPFERLVEHLNPARGQGRPPLFQVEFNFQNTPVSAVELPGLTLRPLRVEREEAAKYDLILRMWEQGDELGGVLTYKSELFEADTAAALAEQLERLLERVAAQPGIRLSELRNLLTEADRKRRAARQEEVRQARRGIFKQVRREAVHEV